MGKTSRWIASLLLYLLALAVGLVTLVPYLWMVVTSFKENKDVFTATLQLWPRHVTFAAYREAWHSLPLARSLLNSLVMATGETLGVILTSVLGGYAFARLRFPGRDALFLLLLGTVMIPTQVTLIPSFILIKHLGWIDTYQGLIVPRVVSAFGVFLMRQFLLTLPRELEEAAALDGCGRLATLFRILLPVSGPALAALAIFTFTNSWNEFFWPLIAVTDERMMTIQVVLAALKTGEVVPWPVLMATTTIATLPTLVLYLLLQRYFTRGIVLSGLKG